MLICFFCFFLLFSKGLEFLTLMRNFEIFRSSNLQYGIFLVCSFAGKRQLAETATVVAMYDRIEVGLSENSVPLHPRVLLIIIPTKWL